MYFFYFVSNLSFFDFLTYYDQKALDAQSELVKIQNQKDLLFCGSYFGYGFHEDGIKSSIEMLKNLND